MRLMTVTEASKAVGLTPWALRQGAIEGRYPHINIGKKRMFDIETLEEALRNEMTARMRTCSENTSEG